MARRCYDSMRLAKVLPVRSLPVHLLQAQLSVSFEKIRTEAAEWFTIISQQQADLLQS